MTMFKIATSLLFLACIGHPAFSQDSGVELLRGASHCLITERQDWLAGQKANSKALDFGYVIDNKSEPGVSHIYVVVYTNSERSRGRVFDLLYQRNASGTLFDVQNNASFVRAGNRIAFVDPPLGGTWAQTHLLSAIRQAGHEASFTLNIVDLTATFPGVNCKSYVGNK